VYKVFDYDEVPTLHYLPAAFLHASLRTAKGIFQESESNSFAVLVGTKYAKNSAFEELVQTNRTVDCANYYPGDAGSIFRGVLEEPGGKFCRDERVATMCLNGTCLTNSSETGCGECQIEGTCLNGTCLTNSSETGCGECQIEGTKFGGFLARWSEERDERLGGLSFHN
jgi:hypothetical protein